MKRKGRLPRTVRGALAKRRLDLVSEKNELIKDILSLGGEAELQMLHDEICAWGESLEDVLPKLSLPRIRRIHARLVTGELPPDVAYNIDL